jgi:hypothetical protein
VNDIIADTTGNDQSRETKQSQRAPRTELPEAYRPVQNAMTSVACETRARDLARLIWNHAEDRDFLQIALTFEVNNLDGHAIQPEVRGWVSYFVRCILHGIAEEIDFQFPDRDPFEESDR